MLKRDRILGPLLGAGIVFGGTVYLFALIAGALIGGAARAVLGGKHGR